MSLSQNEKPTASDNTSPNTCQLGKGCAGGGCGGPGLCPGVAILLAYVAGGGVTLLTGLQWLGWAIGVPLALILITGAWRFLPQRSTAETPPVNISNLKE